MGQTATSFGGRAAATGGQINGDATKVAPLWECPIYHPSPPLLPSGGQPCLEPVRAATHTNSELAYDLGPQGHITLTRPRPHPNPTCNFNPTCNPHPYAATAPHPTHHSPLTFLTPPTHPHSPHTPSPPLTTHHSSLITHHTPHPRVLSLPVPTIWATPQRYSCLGRWGLDTPSS